MEWLRGDYTEVWTTSAVVPLIRFADRVRAIANTGLDLAGIGDEEMPPALAETLAQFDEIISWYGANRPEFRCAVISANRNWRFLPALPPADSIEHVTDFYAQSAGAPLGLRPVLPVKREPKRRTVVIQPFSGSARKNWPLDRFQELARRLPLAAEWIAGPEENLAGAVRTDDLWELAGFIGSAEAYVGNDSGITHLAAATGVRTVALFGATDPRVWGPRGENVTIVAAEGMDAIGVEEVERLVRDGF